MDLPKLRSDLVVSRQERAGAVRYVIKDPLSGRFFQLGEREYAIATLLDGERDLASVAEAFREATGSAVGAETLEKFVAGLAANGLLVGTEPEPARPARFKPRGAPGERGLSRYLMITVKAFDPDRVLDSIVSRVSFLFTAEFVAFAGAAISVALVVAISNREVLWQAMSNVFQFRNLIMAWVGVLAVGMLHEMAHATTCRRFGGRVREMGVLLMYFQPCLFSNVSDAWLFPRKSQRLLVTFAGGFVEMVVWALAVIAWRITAPETALNHLAFIIMAASGITVLFNFNPLIKLDGYYILSDLLDIPNLRQKAFAYLKSLFARTFLGLETREKGLGAREKRIYITYGLVATVYTVGLLGYVLLRLAKFLAHAYGWWTPAVVAAGVLYAMRNQVKEAVEGAAEKVSEHKEEVLSKRRVRIAPMVLLLIVLALLFVPWPLKVSGRFVLLAEKRATVRSEIEGTVAEVHCSEGDAVRAGDPILSLVSAEIESEMKQKEAEIAEAEAQLALLLEGARPQEIARARSDVRAAEVSLELARKEFERAKELREKGLLPDDDFEKAQSAVELAEQELGGKRAELELLLAGSRPEEIDEARATVARLKAEKELLIYKRDRTVVRAPIAGVVLTPFMEQMVGVHLAPGDEICEIADRSVMVAEIAVPEKEVGEVAVGKKVKAKAKGYPSRSFYGKVAAIGEKADPGERQNYVTVRCFLENADGILKPGMTGRAKIYCRRSSPLRIVIRRIVRSIRTEFWW